MNYIYDIILNFNEKFYDFYDWNIDDNIMEVRKIPIFKVDSKVLNDLKNNTFRLNNKFVDKIKNKCEYYIGRVVKTNTSFLLTDGDIIIGLNIGKKNKYSSLQVDDQLDILENISLPFTSLEYELKENNRISELVTRKQIDDYKKLKQTIDGIFKENNISKIKYIYYECFNEKENDIEIIKNRFKNLKDASEVLTRLNNIFNEINTINN